MGTADFAVANQFPNEIDSKVDELTSQIGSQMQTIIATEIFAPIVGEEFAVARMSAFGITGTIASALSFLYKPLSDKFGRKIFLIIKS